MKTSKPLAIVLAVSAALALFTGAVAAPIVCRPFYYAHIGPLELEERTGLTREEIKTAFDEMLDYCQGGEAFSTGALRWSERGKSHFADVRFLFLLDFQALACSLGMLAALALLVRRGRQRPALLLGRGPAFWAGVGLGTLCLLTAALAALDFDRAFTAFHALFFPGKDNWLFGPAQDQIITILPQAFFRNCAVLILVLLISGCAGLIVFDLTRSRRSEGVHSKLEKT